jgi:hypothetical protein
VWSLRSSESDDIGGVAVNMTRWRRRALSLAIGSGTITVAMIGAAAAAPAASGPTSPPFTECPAIGQSPGCEILLVVNPDQTISVLGDPSVGPYDGGDDTLVGVLNNGNISVSAITVTGPGSGLSGFDGDGICTYSFTGDGYCGQQPGVTGYEGPGTSFVTSASQPDSAEVDFTNSLAPGSSAYFSLEGALTSAVLTARQGHLQGLNVNVKVVDAPMPADPAKSANVKMIVTVTNADGTPAAGATVSANGPVPIQVTGTTGTDGTVALLYPVSPQPRSTTVSATLGTESGSANVDVYSSNVDGVCSYPGSPDRLDALSSELDYLLPEATVPKLLDYFANFLNVANTAGELAPRQEQTYAYGYEIIGPNFKTIYALDVEVQNIKTGAYVNSSVLYSHQSGLIKVTTGDSSGLLPLQQLENRLSCGSLAISPGKINVWAQHARVHMSDSLISSLVRKSLASHGLGAHYRR